MATERPKCKKEQAESENKTDHCPNTILKFKHVITESDFNTPASDHDKTEADHKTAKCDDVTAKSDNVTKRFDEKILKCDDVTAKSEEVFVKSNDETAESEEGIGKSDYVASCSDAQTTEAEQDRVGCGKGHAEPQTKVSKHERKESVEETAESVADETTESVVNETSESDETTGPQKETTWLALVTAESDNEATGSVSKTAESDETPGGLGLDYQSTTDADSHEEAYDRLVLEEVREDRWTNVGAYFQEATKTEDTGVENKSQSHDEVFKARPFGKRPSLLQTQMQAFWSTALSMDSKTNMDIRHFQSGRISREVRHWAVEEAGKRADLVDALYIARFCSEEEGNIMMREVAARRDWQLVALLVAHQLVSKSTRQWAVEEAARLADPDKFTALIMPCCFHIKDLNHDRILAKLVERGDFQLAMEMLDIQRCSKASFAWVLKEAARAGVVEQFPYVVRPSWIEGMELDSIMLTVAKRNFWPLVRFMLNFDCVVDYKTRMEAVLMAQEQASCSEFFDILSACFPEELDSVLVRSVRQSRWHLAVDVLRAIDFRLKMDQTKWRTLNSKLYADDSLCRDILQQFDKTVLFSIFEEDLKQRSPMCDLMHYLFSREWYYTHRFKILSTIAPNETASQTCQRMWASNQTFLGSFEEMSDIFQEVFATLKGITPGHQSPEWPNAADCLQRWTQVALDTHARVKDECSSGERGCMDTELFRDWEYLLVQLLLQKAAPLWSYMDYSQFGWLLTVLALVPLIPILQSVCLKCVAGPQPPDIYLDLVGHTCWFHVPEEVRRFVFRTAVERGDWGAVTQLADHSLYDDERGWALGQAMASGQWSAFLRLAQHGLNADQRRRVYRQVAKHGDWPTVQAMFERGADVRSVFAELFTANISRDPNPPEDVVARYKHRLRQLRNLAKKLAKKAKNFDAALKKKNWSAVLYKTRRGGTEQEVWQAMMAAMEARAWHVLIALVRGSNTASQREELFPLLMGQQQWSVLRTLLEQGVRVELSLSALPVFLERHQWLLAARVTEYDVTDSVIRHVIQHALAHQEGSLVAHCMGSQEPANTRGFKRLKEPTIMEVGRSQNEPATTRGVRNRRERLTIQGGRTLKEPLSVTERRTIFQQALSQGLWWAVRRLVEEKDAEAEREEALQSSAERQQWSVLTHCLQHGAHVDRRDREGNTLLHRWAQRGDWTGVVRLVEQGADHNIPDSQGYTVLHRFVQTKHPPQDDLRHDPLKHLVEFHGDIFRPDPKGISAWEYIMAGNNAAVIDTVLMWSQVDTQTVDKCGNTALHKVATAGFVGAVRSLVARGNSPLAVNKEGMTAFCSATTHHNHKMTLEFIKLGVGTFQPQFTDACPRMSGMLMEVTRYGVQQHELASPFQRAAVECDLRLMEALYEAGACSNAELHRFRAALKAHQIPLHSHQVMYDYVERRACNPRSLQSSCRLALCHQLGVRRDRERRVRQLDRLDDRERHQQLDTHMVHYLLFSDLEQEFPYPAELRAPEAESPSQSDEVRLAKIQSLLATGKISFRGKMHDYYLREFMLQK